VAEPIPNHVTSLVLMALLVFFGVRDEDKVLAALGLSVIWLNITAFVMSSVLVKTNLARRLALTLVTRQGHSAGTILFAFLLLQLALAPLIPATAARAVMTLPIMMVVRRRLRLDDGQAPTSGRSLLLQNLLGINMFSSGFLTGSAANLVAAAFILDMAQHKVYYTEWLAGALPVVLLTGLITHYVFPRWFFPLAPEQKAPVIPGGLDRLRGELGKMGPLSGVEKKGAAIFGLVLLLWMTDKFHMGWFGFEVSAVMAALIGSVLAFFPRLGLLKWNEADIPWHLLIFSAGAYAGGTALTDTGAAQWAVGVVFDALGWPGDNFWSSTPRSPSRLLASSSPARRCAPSSSSGRDRHRAQTRLRPGGARPAGRLHPRLGWWPRSRQAQRHPLQHRAVLR
jgi:anion transporter